MRFEPIIVKKKAPNRTFTGSVGYNLAEAVGFEPTNELPRYRISSAGRYDHFDTLPLNLLYILLRFRNLLTHYSIFILILQQILSCISS